jgi:hypothetical protein
MKNSQQPSEDGFDFNEWTTLARIDPEGFAHRRLTLIRTAIASAPERSRARLEGLQFRIDAECRLARTPMKACLHLSSMMWDSFLDLEEALASFSGQQDFPLHSPSDSARPAARVILFGGTQGRRLGTPCPTNSAPDKSRAQ